MKAIQVHDRADAGPRRQRSVARGLLAGGSLALLLSSGCAEAPRRAWEGARLYSAGTRSLEAGDAATAVDELSRAADLVPQASEIQNHLAMAYWTLGQLDEAEAAFDEALVLDCENEAARSNRDRLLAERKRSALAEEGGEHGG